MCNRTPAQYDKSTSSNSQIAKLTTNFDPAGRRRLLVDPPSASGRRVLLSKGVVQQAGFESLLPP
jgi:hypothetical protein